MRTGIASAAVPAGSSAAATALGGGRRTRAALVAAAASGNSGTNAAAGSSQPTNTTAPRRRKNAGLYDLDDADAGWGVSVVDSTKPSPPGGKKKATASSSAPPPSAAKPPRRNVRMPYVDLASQAGVAGLEMLRQSLAGAEEEDEQQQQQPQQQSKQQPKLQQRSALLEAARKQNRAGQQRRAKLPGMVEAAAAAMAEREAQQKLGLTGGRAGADDDEAAADDDDGDDNDSAANDDHDDDDSALLVPEFTVTYSGDTGELESFMEKDPRTGRLREARAPWQQQQQQGRRVFVAGDGDEDEEDNTTTSELSAFGDDLLADAFSQYGGGAAATAVDDNTTTTTTTTTKNNVPLALAAWQDVLEEVEMAGGWEQLEALPGGALATDAPAFRLVPAAPGAVEDFESTMGTAALFREEEAEEEEEEEEEEHDDDDDATTAKAADWRGPAAAVLPATERAANNKKQQPPPRATNFVRQSAPLSGLARPDRRREVQGSDAAFYAGDEEEDDNEDDPAGARRGRRSLFNTNLDDLDEEGRQNGPTVVWGGTGGVTGLDLEEQAAVLARYFQPSEASKLLAQQRAADAEHAELRLRAAGKGGGLGADNERRLHRELRILAGTAANRRILSSRGETTRPMMAKVRGAAFSMIAALSGAGSATALPSTARWLDLFAGTGSIGLEALSRGAREAHFVEMDPWVAKRVLSRNITACGFDRRAVTHTTRAEDFLRRALGNPRFAGGAFDFVSICPPYLLVSYPELFDLFQDSPLLGSSTVALVEYPKQLSGEIRATLGPLRRVRDRKYGRTYLALYAGADTPAGAAAAALAGGFDGDGDERDYGDEDDDDDDGDEDGGGRAAPAAAPTGWEI
jgi:16S rRNA (guanine(966)-N(2))-methyltransferase RsmD